MVAIAPDTDGVGRPGLARSVPRDWEPGTGRAVEDPRAGHRPAHRDDHGARRRTTSRGPPRRAKAAQPAWAETSYQERAAILRRAADIYEANRDEFGTWTQRETGAIASKMHHERTSRSARSSPRRRCRGSRTARSCRPSSQGRLSMVRRVPVGVVGAITPWNSPSCWACASSRRRWRSAMPSSSSRIRRRRSSAARCSRRSSGRPACPTGLLQIVVGGADVGEALVTDPNMPGRVVHRLDRGRAAGRRLGRRPAQEGRLELGGNNALIVLDDADLSRGRGAARSRPSSSRARSASPPAATSSIASVADEYVDLLAEKARRLRHGRPVPRGRRARADRQREAARARRRHRPALDRRRRRTARRGRHVRGPVLPADGLTEVTTGPRRPGPTRSSARSRRS